MMGLLKTLVWVGTGAALACHLWAANRGLEMTDEASYLLIALDPWGTRGHGTFHGFLLRPLYLLGGQSLVGLRWIGYATLLFGAWRLAGAVRLRLGQEKSAVADFCTPVLMVAAMTVYCAGIRTPCYNWMILLGAILAWSGWLRCGLSRNAPFEMGLGLAVALVGKWTATPFLVGILLVPSFFKKNHGWGPGRSDWVGAFLVGLAAAVGLLFYAGLEGIQNTLQAGIIAAQTIGSHGWFLVPKYAWEMFYYLYRVARAFVWLLPAILVFWWLAKRNPKKWKPEKIAMILFTAGLALAAARGWWRGGIEQFGKESVFAGCWLLGVAWTVRVVRREADTGRPGNDKEKEKSMPASILWAMVLTPFLCGIGTNTSIADYAGQGTVFFAAVGILMLGSLPAVSIQSVAALSLAGLCLIQASRVSSSLLRMYRLGSVLDQNENLEVGPEASRLRVDRYTRLQVEAIWGILQHEGFRPRTPVVGVDSLCGWVYLAGGTSPGVPWFQRDQAEFGRQVLAKCDVRALRSSWLWIRSSSQMKDPERWWPPQIPAPSWREAGQVVLATDRGAEKLLLLLQKRDN
jgi:hypothetical protein